MGREIRRVPAGWEHPKGMYQRLVMGNSGDIIADFLRGVAQQRHEWCEEYKPLYDRSYKDAKREWDENNALWAEGKHPDQLAGHGEGMTWEEWDGAEPDPDYYRPHWTPEEATHYQMYETVSEGTPVSPVFASLEELAEHMVSVMGYSPQAAKAFCKSGWAPSAVFSPGMGLKDGITAEGIFAAKDNEHQE